MSVGGKETSRQFSEWRERRRRRSELTIDLILVITEDDDWRRSLLQAFEQVNHLGFLFHVLDFLKGAKARSR